MGRKKTYKGATLGTQKFCQWLKREGRFYHCYSKILDISPATFLRLLNGTQPPTIVQAYTLEHLTEGVVKMQDWAIYLEEGENEEEVSGNSSADSSGIDES